MSCEYTCDVCGKKEAAYRERSGEDGLPVGWDKLQIAGRVRTYADACKECAAATIRIDTLLKEKGVKV